jgi:hypothetical protein
MAAVTRDAHDRPVRRAVLVLASGCLVPYTPGALSAHDAVTSVGCLDVGLAAMRRAETSGPVVEISLGNRCEHHVDVDLGALQVVAGNNGGATAAARAYDPDHEIEARTIAARESGDEYIEYLPVTPLAPIEWLDVDVAGVAPDAARREHWVRVQVTP